MPLVPVYGHLALQDRLRDSAARHALPASLLFVGPRGVGKQRLALWLAQVLLCAGDEPRPCGACQHCRFSAELTHPDLHWFFPRARLKASDPSLDDVRQDYAEGIAERVKARGLYAPPSGSEGIYVVTVRALVRTAAMSPAMARRKVFIIGDAERMVPQEGSDEAANAFLKLLEEPPADTQIILTSSEPGALLPTVRSRVVTVRVPAVAESDVRAFVDDPAVAAQLKKMGVAGGGSVAELVRAAGGAPGRLFAFDEWSSALENARSIVDAATGRDRAARYRTAFMQGGSGARGKYSDMLDALTTVLHERARAAVVAHDERTALGAARGIDAVERAKERAQNNANPQLLTASLVRELSGALG